MKVNDNYLKEQLKHVYWLNGGCCAGKTTMTKKFVEELGFQTLEDDVLKYRPFTSLLNTLPFNILIPIWTGINGLINLMMYIVNGFFKLSKK